MGRKVKRPPYEEVAYPWTFPCDHTKVHPCHYYLDIAARTWFCPGVAVKPRDIEERPCAVEAAHLPHLYTDGQGAYWFCNGEGTTGAVRRSLRYQ